MVKNDKYYRDTVVKTLLGHTDIHVTIDTYTDVLGNVRRASIDQFDDYLGNA